MDINPVVKGRQHHAGSVHVAVPDFPFRPVQLIPASAQPVPEGFQVRKITRLFPMASNRRAMWYQSKTCCSLVLNQRPTIVASHPRHPSQLELWSHDPCLIGGARPAVAASPSHPSRSTTPRFLPVPLESQSEFPFARTYRQDYNPRHVAGAPTGGFRPLVLHYLPSAASPAESDPERNSPSWRGDTRKLITCRFEQTQSCGRTPT